MYFVPIISLLNGVMGSGFISHAINLYLRCKSSFQIQIFYFKYSSFTLCIYLLFFLFLFWEIFNSHNYGTMLFISALLNSDKPPIEELHQFLEFQLPRQWAPSYGDLPLGPQRKKNSLPSLQFSLMGPKLYVNTTQVKIQNFHWLH